jgi:hypothetical protein
MAFRLNLTHHPFLQIQFFSLLFVFVVLGFELKAYTLSHSTSPFFVMSFFQIGYCELFSQADFELWSS